MCVEIWFRYYGPFLTLLAHPNSHNKRKKIILSNPNCTNTTFPITQQPWTQWRWYGRIWSGSSLAIEECHRVDSHISVLLNVCSLWEHLTGWQWAEYVCWKDKYIPVPPVKQLSTSLFCIRIKVLEILEIVDNNLIHVFEVETVVLNAPGRSVGKCKSELCNQ